MYTYIVNFLSNDVATVETYINHELKSRKSVRAVAALQWMVKQRVKWIWNDKNTVAWYTKEA